MRRRDVWQWEECVTEGMLSGAGSVFDSRAPQGTMPPYLAKCLK